MERRLGVDDGNLVIVDVRANSPLKLSGPRADSLKVGPQPEKMSSKGTNGAMAKRALIYPVRATGQLQKREVVPLADLVGSARRIAAVAFCWVVTRDVLGGPLSLAQRNADITGIFGASRHFDGVCLGCGGYVVASRVLGRLLACAFTCNGVAVAAAAGVSV